MQTKFQELESAGSTGEDFLEKRRQILTRKATLTGSFVTILFCIADSTLNRTLLAPVLIFTFYTSLFLFLSGRSANTLHKYIYIAALNLLVSFIAFKEGTATGIHLMLFPVMAYSLLVFEIRKYLHSFTCIVSSLALLVYLEQNRAIQHDANMHNIAGSHTIYCLLSAILTLHYLYNFFLSLTHTLKSGERNRLTLHSIIENTPDAVLLLDQQWNVIEVNSVFGKWFKRITGNQFEKGSDICAALKKFETASPGITDRWLANIKKNFTGLRFSSIEKICYRNYNCTVDIYTNPVIENEVITGVSIYIRNITHAAKEKQLLKDELIISKKLAGIPDVTDSSILVTDTSFRITWANEGFRKLTGYSTHECINKKPRELLGVSFFDNSRITDEQNQLEKGESVTVIKSFELKDGNKKWISASITPVCNERGICEEFVIIMTDVTSIKQKEESLDKEYREAQKMALVANSSEISVVITDKRNIIQWINQGFIKFFGYELNQCEGKEVLQIFTNNTQQNNSVRFEANILSCKNFTYEMQVFKSNSELCWVSFNVTPYFNEKDELDKYIYIISDITARKEEEEQIRKLLVQDKERIWMNRGLADLSDILRSSQDDEEQLYQNILKFMTSITGSSFAQFKLIHISGDKDSGLSVATHGMLFHNHQQVKDCPFDCSATMKNGFEIYNEKSLSHYMISCEDGLQPLQEIYSTKIRVSNNSVLTMLLYSYNCFNGLQQQFMHRATETISQTIEIFKRKKDTEMLLQETQQLNQKLNTRGEELKNTIAELNTQRNNLHASQSELEHQNKKLSEKTKELEAAREDLNQKAVQLEQSNRFKTEFLANMSHELRTPLNSIIILSRLLLENKEKTLTQRQLEFARVVNKSGDDLLELINDILDLSKIEAGRIELELSEVEISEISDDMMNLFNEVAREKNINFAVTKQQGIGNSIVTDRIRTEQIIKNLLSNAFKFTPEFGSVCLNICRNESNIDFQVIDTGVGIPKEKQQLIFEAFRQADGSINRKYGGTGLGLSISRELAAILNGKITLSSLPGKGSTFALSIPMLNIPESSSTKFTALVIEDNEEENHAIRFMLSKQGYNCIAAFGVKEAMNQLTEIKIHALVLDLNLPDGNGIDILKHIKETPSLTDISIIIYTSRELENGEREILKRYSNIVIRKENKSILTLQEETVRFLQKLHITKQSSRKEKLTGVGKLNMKGKNVLIVDDDERNIFAISHTLEGQEVNIYKASSGHEAIRQLKINPEIDLILMDVMMPGMDGIETVKIIRTETQHKNVPVIAITAKAMKHDKELCLSAGMDEYVTKPIDTNQLLLVMNSFFQ